MVFSVFKNYSGIIYLLVGISVGSALGIFFPAVTVYVKPLGDVFLNFLFVCVVPLIFFAVAHSISDVLNEGSFGKLFARLIFTFVLFVVLAAIFSISTLYLFPIKGILISGEDVKDVVEVEKNWGDRVVDFFSVGEFTSVFSRKHMLSLLIFSFLLGISVQKSGEKGVFFKRFFASGYEVSKQTLLIIMRAAPIGLGAYFAYQAASLGSELFGLYAFPLLYFYGIGFVYFVLFFSFYAYISFGGKGVSIFWKNNIYPSLTALSTCSSFATVPANIQAALKMGIPPSIVHVVIPLGSTLHKTGSSISSIIKIYVAFLIMGKDFFDPVNLLIALGITLFVTVVAGGIPNGGYIGEMLMISAYNFPVETLPSIMIIGTLVDPLATVLNATGDNIAAIFITRLMGDKLESIGE
ncbi:MAG: dicarboxylate/amino acid:cation symporter [Bergeyella sp.]|nr:dicarboxylate/amino acid:cation symporter [Bergeyella sp.]